MITARYQTTFLLPCVLVLVLMSSSLLGRHPVKQRYPSKYIVEVPVPKVLRLRLLNRVIRLTAAAYPQADLDQIRRHFEKQLMREAQRFRISKAMGVTWTVQEDEVGLAICSKFPWGREVLFWTPNLPKGVDAKPLSEPLSKDKAKTVAKGFLKRLYPNLSERKRFKYSESGYGMVRKNEIHRFVWISQPKQSSASTESILITVRRKDGLINGIRITSQEEVTTKITREAILKRAKKQIKGFNPEYLRLDTLYYYTSVATVWEYVVPPSGTGRNAPPGTAIEGGVSKDRTIWDANTGKILYSEVLNGGTCDKPYRCPEFFFEPTKEAVTARLRKLIEKQTAELKLEYKRGGLGRPPRED